MNIDINHASWLNGCHVISDWKVTINTSLSFVSFEPLPDKAVSEFNFQGDEADKVIDEMTQFWKSHEELTQWDVIEHWALMMLY